MPKEGRGPLQAGGLKVVVRKLPPTLSSDEFRASIAPYVTAETRSDMIARGQSVAELLYYDPGKIKAEYARRILTDLTPVTTAILSHICSSAVQSKWASS